MLHTYTSQEMAISFFNKKWHCFCLTQAKSTIKYLFLIIFLKLFSYHNQENLHEYIGLYIDKI
jgi:hypothetical protein